MLLWFRGLRKSLLHLIRQIIRKPQWFYLRRNCSISPFSMRGWVFLCPNQSCYTFQQFTSSPQFLIQSLFLSSEFSRIRVSLAGCFFRQWNLVAKHISRNHFVDISITLGQKRLFRQMGYNLFAKVAILPKGYYFCAKGEAEGGEIRLLPFYVLQHPKAFQ